MRDAARTLFDDRPRGGPPHMTYGECVFDFYNRVDRADWARFRNRQTDEGQQILEAVFKRKAELAALD